MSWDEATKLWAEQTGPDDGFYLSLQVRFFCLLDCIQRFWGLNRKMYLFSFAKHIESYIKINFKGFSSTEYEILPFASSGYFLIGLWAQINSSYLNLHQEILWLNCEVNVDYCVLEVYYCPWLYYYTLILLCKEHSMESLMQIFSSFFNWGRFWFIFFFFSPDKK